MNNGVNSIVFWLFFCLVVFPTSSLAQSTTPPIGIANSGLSDSEKRGEGLFLQRCSVCHLPKPLKPKTQPSFGPSLSGLLKDEKSAQEKEKVVRQVILNGGEKMPGFQYGLEPKEIDDLIAYLKTL